MNAERPMGLKIRDRLTGFEGICTGRAEYLYGCAQLLLIPKKGKDGKFPEGVWVDEQRCEAVGSRVVNIQRVATSGGPQIEAPKH